MENPTGYEIKTATQAFSALATQQERIKIEQERLELIVAAARKIGTSWESIGAALKLSKQTAYNRYGKAEKQEKALESWRSTMNDVQKHHTETAKFFDGEAPAKAEATQLVDYATDSRPSFTLHSAGFKDGIAQPGTGKGPHACPRCGCTNHKGSENQVRAYPGECKPTKYDPADIAAVVDTYLKASK